MGHLRKIFGKKKKLAILLDNSSVHRSMVVRMLFEEDDITPIFIVPYSPQQNGIEHLWGVMKY